MGQPIWPHWPATGLSFLGRFSGQFFNVFWLFQSMPPLGFECSCPPILTYLKLPSFDLVVRRLQAANFLIGLGFHLFSTYLLNNDGYHHLGWTHLTPIFKTTISDRPSDARWWHTWMHSSRPSEGLWRIQVSCGHFQASFDIASLVLIYNTYDSTLFWSWPDSSKGFSSRLLRAEARGGGAWSKIKTCTSKLNLMPWFHF